MISPGTLVILATQGGSYMNLTAEIDNFSTTDGGVSRFLPESDSGGDFIVAAWGFDRRKPCIKHVDKVSHDCGRKGEQCCVLVAVLGRSESRSTAVAV
ncbi:hypothetical protein TSUD_90420 [Trifolium subterraneum]|uniref:Uncharacterized protein n=1 Tax=Trifolium subterraneum TaxID=3900 RepID=A0A2Z6LQ77_TRISU|nr:hypothetical protein TSUD_90420 [Trifolium subterraneum]